MADSTPEGDIVSHYRVDGLLGEGAMSVVHRATDVRTGRAVALKLLSPEHAGEPKARARLLWIKDGPASSLELYASHRGTDFAPHTYFSLTHLPRTIRRDVLVAITNDETDPAASTTRLTSGSFS